MVGGEVSIHLVEVLSSNTTINIIHLNNTYLIYTNYKEQWRCALTYCNIKLQQWQLTRTNSLIHNSARQ